MKEESIDQLYGDTPFFALRLYFFALLGIYVNFFCLILKSFEFFNDVSYTVEQLVV